MSSESAPIVERLWNYCNVLAQEIVGNLESALTQCESILEELGEE